MERNVFNNATIVKSNGAILTPQLGTADLAGISPQVGQIAYNTDTSRLIVYTTDWKDVAIAGGSSGAFDNLLLSGNTLSSTNTNGNIILSPNGTGTLQVMKGANFNSNTVSGVTTLTATTVTATNLGGTLTTPAQGNVTSLGAQASNLDMNTNKIINLGTPTLTTDATTKTYVDSADNLKLNLSGGTMSGAIAMGSNAISGVTTLTATTVTATNLGGTLTTPAQPNVTSMGTQTAALNMGANKIIGLATPTLDSDATTKLYVDTADNLKLNLSGGTMSGELNMGNQKITNALSLNATTVTATTVNGTLSSGIQPGITSIGIQVGSLNMNSNKIINLGTPTLTTDATTKTYVDSANNLKLNLSGGTMSGAIAMGSNAISGVTTLTATNVSATTTTTSALVVTNNPHQMRKKYNQQTISTATNTLLSWEVLVSNDSTNRVTYTDTGTDFYFTVLTAGTYSVTYNIVGVLGTNQLAETWVLLNTANPADSTQTKYGWCGIATSGRFCCSFKIELAANDVLRTVYWQNSGGNQFIPQSFLVTHQMHIAIYKDPS